MKRFTSCLLASAALAGALVISSSCRKDDPVTPVVITVECYTAGNECDNSGVTTPVIYKNADVLYRFGSGSFVSGVAYAGGDLYSCGSRDGKLALWKNDKLSNGDAENGAFTDMAGDGTNWYCCGNVTKDDKSYGVIYKNGTEVYRSETPSTFYAVDFGASGDYYVACADDAVRVLRISSEGKGVTDAMLISSDLKYVPTDLFVGVKDICVSLNYRTVDDDYACCWLSTETDVLKLSNKTSHANCAALFNGYFIIGGDALNTSGNQFAVQWVNGVGEDYSYGCNPGYSSVKLLKSGTLDLFEAIESPGQVQLCVNGGALDVIKCAESFQVSAWDIVVK